MLLTAEQPQTGTEGPTDASKLIQPRDHKAKIVVWADLTVDDVDRLNESLNVDHNKQVLADIFHLDAWREDPKQAIVMDLYYYTLQFARNNNFTREKTSTFFSIIKKTHEVDIETPFGNLDQTFRYFKELVLCHAVNRPPHSIELFTVDEVRKLTEYAINTYFRHFKMYKYAFTPLVRLDLTINYHGVPVVSPEPTEAGDVDEDTTKDQETATEELEGEKEPEKEGESGTESGEGEVVEGVLSQRRDTSSSSSEEQGNEDDDDDDGVNEEEVVTSDDVMKGEEEEEVTSEDVMQEEGLNTEGMPRATSTPAEESEERKELRAMIQTYLAEEIKKVKVTVDEQLKTTEETLSKKIETAEAIGKKSPRKDSAKRKK